MWFYGTWSSCCRRYVGWWPRRRFWGQQFSLWLLRTVSLDIQLILQIYYNIFSHDFPVYVPDVFRDVSKILIYDCINCELMIPSLSESVKNCVTRRIRGYLSPWFVRLIVFFFNTLFYAIYICNGVFKHIFHPLTNKW